MTWKRRSSGALMAFAALGALAVSGIIAPATETIISADGLIAQTRMTGIPFGHLPNDPNDHPEKYGRPPKRPLFPPPPPPPPPIVFVDTGGAADPPDS